jgi:transposase-like protein
MSESSKTTTRRSRPMRRVPPSVIAREELDQLLAHGGTPQDNVISRLVELATRFVVQQLLEGDQADFLGGRGRYVRRGEDDSRGLRNGYVSGRLRSAEGEIPVSVPQVRGAGQTYRPALMGFLEGNSEVLERLVCEMYARGMSTRDIEDAFRDPDGEPMLSRTAVSEITDALWEAYETFCSRDLSGIEVQYLFVDAIFESLRRYGAKEAVLVAWCIDSEGHKHLLHMAVGNKESEVAWTEFFHHMIHRGLGPPVAVTSDGAPGLINAIKVVFSHSLRIRCWFHRLGNLRAKLLDDDAPQVMAEIRAIRDAPTLEAARAQAER